MKEIWKRIEECPNYEISNFGNVRNQNKHILKQTIHSIKKLPYLYLDDGIERHPYLIQVLVARYFVDNPNDYRVIDHLNGNAFNNRADNLAWVSSINECHKITSHRFVKEINKKHIKRNHKYNNNHIRKEYDLDHRIYCPTNGKYYRSTYEASIDTGISMSSIGRCCRDNYGEVRGYDFCYVTCN